MNKEVRFRILVSGRVQGVWYRRSAKSEADKLGVTGWARNLIDGKVEMICEGAEENTKAFLEWARTGPFFAHVRDIEVHEEPYQGEFSSFEVRDFGF